MKARIETGPYVLMGEAIHSADDLPPMAALTIERARLLHEITWEIEALAYRIGEANEDNDAAFLRRGMLARLISLNAAAMDVVGGEPVATEDLRKLVLGPWARQAEAATLEGVTP